MNSRTSSAKIFYLISYDLKRYWILPAVSFAVLFLFTCFQILLQYDSLENMARNIEEMTSFGNPTQIAAAGITPVIAALTVFHYLHKVNAVTAMHSLPLTRRQLFIGHAAAGFLLCLLPVLVNSLIMLLLARPVYDDTGSANVFTVSAVLMTLLAMTAAMLFIYAVSVLAGMLTGTLLMHAAAAMGLNILLPAAVMFAGGYCGMFLNGFDVNMFDGCRRLLSALSGLSDWPEAGHIWMRVIIYVLISLLILLTGYLLYEKRKLENAGDHLVCGFMVPVTCDLITFFLATAVTATLPAEHFVILLAGITVIVYMFTRMFLLKTAHIFNRKTLTSFCVYGMLLTLFLSALSFDITGYEKRMPDTAKFTAVSTNAVDSALPVDTIIERISADTVFRDKENIQKAMRVHKAVRQSKRPEPRFDIFDLNSAEDGVNFSYTGSGSRLHRLYHISDPKYLLSIPEVRELYESDEYKDSLSILNEEVMKRRNIYGKLNVDLQSSLDDADLPIAGADEKKSLIQALDSDMKDRTFEEATAFGAASSIGRVYISLADTEIRELFIYSSDSNTVAWLKEHGYYGHFDLSGLAVEQVTAILDKDGKSLFADLSPVCRGRDLEEFLERYDNNSPYPDDCAMDITVSGPGGDISAVFTIYYDKDALPDLLRHAEWKEETTD